MVACECAAVHERRRVVLTGGPGAGKTAVLELIRQSFCEHVKVLPEAAGIVFGGGFPREDELLCRRAAQRAIFYVQRERIASLALEARQRLSPAPLRHAERLRGPVEESARPDFKPLAPNGQKLGRLCRFVKD